MTTILAGGSVGVDNPVVLFLYQEKRPVGSNGLTKALYSLSFRIDKDGLEYIDDTTVDVDSDFIDTAGTIYYATFETDEDDSPGEYVVTWTYKVTEDAAEKTATTKFTLASSEYPLVAGYAQVSDLVAEGVPIGDEDGEVSVTIAVSRLEEASKYVERFCHRKFYPHFEEVSLDSRKRSQLILDESLIAVSDLSYEADSELVSMGEYVYRVYNRHIRQGLLNPDDRNAPRIELKESCRFVRNTPQQIFLDAVFGYTDPDGTVFGCTPGAIKECVLRLALRDLAPLYDPETGSTSTTKTGPVQAEKTYDQSVSYANVIFAREGLGTAYVGYVTGDPRIDQILFSYKRPVLLGTVR